MSEPIQAIPVIDVDQAFPLLTSDGGRASSSSGGGTADVSPTVEAAIRDVLGWRPRAQDTAAFTAALTASIQLSEYEGHVVATYRPRGYAMQADLGAVTGGQASLYTRAIAARVQMFQLLDGLVPLRSDADKEDCEAYRTLVRDAVTALIAELGTPGGPRVAVVDAYLRQLLGTASTKLVDISEINADNVNGQLGQLRIQFGLEDRFVNNTDEEGIRTAFWTLVDLIVDTKRAWTSLRQQFTGAKQHGFLGTQLVLINQLLSAVAEQVDEVEAVLESVFVSSAERQTITINPETGLSLDGLLRWARSFVTEEGPRIARDTGRDGIATSFTPTLLDIVAEVSGLLQLMGRPSFSSNPIVTAYQKAVAHLDAEDGHRPGGGGGAVTSGGPSGGPGAAPKAAGTSPAAGPAHPAGTTITTTAPHPPASGTVAPGATTAKPGKPTPGAPTAGATTAGTPAASATTAGATTAGATTAGATTASAPTSSTATTSEGGSSEGGSGYGGSTGDSSPPPPPDYGIQIPLITMGSGLPPGLQSSRARIAVSGLDSMLMQLSNLAVSISRYPDAVLLDALVLTGLPDEVLVVIRGISLQPTYIPVFRYKGVGELRPLVNRTTYDGDTISTVFKKSDLITWLGKYEDATKQTTSLARIAKLDAGAGIVPAHDAPLKLIDSVTGKKVRKVQTQP